MEAERKNKLLRSVAGGGVDQLGELRSQWDKFELMLESHQLMIQEQVTQIQCVQTCYCIVQLLLLSCLLTSRPHPIINRQES